uniref:DUF1618 domain-containing protein n=1 Tax=Oryza meridionalis TaxID=40149 RepID=A0A0E0DQ11_9ORYZ
MASGSGEGKGRRHQDDIPSVVLLELWGHVADDDQRADATTGTSTTSTGLPISVTLCAATPPSLSHLSVDCPGLVDLDPNPSDKFVAPTVISTDADLVLLRVPVDRFARFDHCFSDYLVYKVSYSHPESAKAKLHRLPSPRGRGFADDNIAILSCGNDDDDDSYAVAALQPLHHVHFRLHLCRSTPDGKPGSWTSHQLTVEEPLRGTVCPLPDSALRRIFHATTKVITLGGAKGTVGWVDLWRGILLCDVLDEIESPKLRDLPLPLPSKGNWPLFLNRCPYYCRDIVVNQSRDTIKYVEMEFTILNSSQDPRSSYYEWVASQEFRSSQLDILVDDGSWKVNTWNMPIPVTSWDDWKPGCSVTSNHLDTALHSYMRKIDYKRENAAISVESLHTAYPTLSIADDDDVVYLLSKRTTRGAAKMVFTVNMRARVLEELEKLHSMSHLGFMRCFLSTGISKHLKPTVGKQNGVGSPSGQFSFL